MVCLCWQIDFYYVVPKLTCPSSLEWAILSYKKSAGLFSEKIIFGWKLSGLYFYQTHFVPKVEWFSLLILCSRAAEQLLISVPAVLWVHAGMPFFRRN